MLLAIRAPLIHYRVAGGVQGFVVSAFLLSCLMGVRV